MDKGRIESLETIKKLTEYDDYNVYSMDIKYDYNLDNLTPTVDGVPNNQEVMDSLLKEALPGVPISIEAPDFACSAFTLKSVAGAQSDVMMGRNYDFKLDTSAMIVNCSPKGGYRSIATAALDNVKANDPFSSEAARAACLAAPFVCLDGMNEKGVSIAVLTLDSEPTCHRTGKPVLPTGILMRLVLDKAASTEEAVELISKYDIFSTCGRDYHFYITDASGDGRVVEFDCDDPERKLAAVPMSAITNFFALHIDKVLPHQNNEHYGHGKERYDAIEAVLKKADEKACDGGRENSKNGEAFAWEALKAASQLPKTNDVTSNTQWSIVYNNTKLSYDIVLRRHWEDILNVEPEF